MSEGAFFQDLAMLMTVAGLVSVVFAKLKWPKVIGYILAGIVMSEYTWGGSFLADTASVRTIGQLGVVFLMFTMGLGFSTTRMRAIRHVALPVAVLDTVVMTWLGYTLGTRVLGWGSVPSLFLGAAICDSATTMLAKVIGEMHWETRPFVSRALGASVCEDIVCVGILALVTGVANGQGLSLRAAGTSLGGLLVFFIATLVFGLILVPRLLASVARAKDDEALLLTILGCLFFVSYVAYRFEFSLALGAFLVGILGASSDVRTRLSALSAPLQSMFAAVFFVSIGLLFDPSACWRHLGPILLLTFAVVAGKFVNCTLGSLACGEDLRTALAMGLSLAQIGEFAFMIAILYLGATGDWASPIFPTVVAVSLVTTLLNPLAIRLSEPIAAAVERGLPARVLSALATYRDFVAKYRSESSRNEELRAEVRHALVWLGTIAVLHFAVSTVCSLLSRFDYTRFSVFFERHDKMVFFLVSNFFALSLLPTILRFARILGEDVSIVLVTDESVAWRQALRNVIAHALVVAILAAFLLEITMLNVSLAPPSSLWAHLVVLAILVTSGFAGWRFFKRTGLRAVRRFNDALGSEARQARLQEVVTTVSLPKGTLHRLTLDLASPAVGETIGALDIRAKTGATVVSVEREGSVVRNVGADFELHCSDTLVALGDSAQCAALKDLLGITVTH